MDREVITSRAHGIDISHYQETYVYAQTFGQVDFAIQKITEGDFWQDANWQKLWNDGTAQVPIRGTYHYYRDNQDWKKQMDLYLSMIAKLSPAPHIIALDVEEVNNVNTWGAYRTQFFLDVRDALAYLEKALPDKRIVFYTNPNTFNQGLNLLQRKFGANTKLTDFLFSYPLWLAQYAWTGRSPDKQPLTPTKRGDWDLWQYTDKGDSTQLVDGHTWRRYGSPDLDVFNGSVAQMREWAKVDAGTVVTPPPPAGNPIQIQQVSIKLSNETEIILK